MKASRTISSHPVHVTIIAQHIRVIYIWEAGNTCYMWVSVSILHDVTLQCSSIVSYGHSHGKEITLSQNIASHFQILSKTIGSDHLTSETR